MNPSTDIGKKDLPTSIRNRFTELYVDELTDNKEWYIVAQEYLQNVINDDTLLNNIVGLYLSCRRLSQEILCDGGGNRPRYTLRTFTRALNAIKSLIVMHRITDIKRAILEGFELAFEGPLDLFSRISRKY